MNDHDPLRAPQVDPAATRANGGGAFYLAAGLLIAIVLAGGLLFYNPTVAPGERNDQARQPDRPAERIIEAPGTPPRPNLPRQ